jgi:hypothetical protein
VKKKTDWVFCAWVKGRILEHWKRTLDWALQKRASSYLRTQVAEPTGRRWQR